jgi:excisionase family DNA binding protein
MRRRSDLARMRWRTLSMPTTTETTMINKTEARNDDTTPQEPSPPTLHSVAEVAEMLGMSGRYVWREIAAKRLVVHRFGRATRISAGELETYIARHRKGQREN